MIIAGLTGGIATGKSTVAEMFMEAGAVIVDADRIAHDVVKKGLPAWQKIVDHFGEDVLSPDGEIDRDRLGDIIFKNHDEKRELNGIVHPFVFQEMAVKIEQAKKAVPDDGVIVLDVPLLIEGGMHEKMEDVILVYIPEVLQVKRLMQRNSLSEEDAMARIHSQMPIEEKKALADILIDNSSTLEKTKERVCEVYGGLREKSSAS